MRSVPGTDHLPPAAFPLRVLALGQGETVCTEPVKVGLCGVHLLLQEMHGHLKRGLAPGKNLTPAFVRLREAVRTGVGEVEETRHLRWCYLL